jgi:hypothetical protein
VEYRVLYFSKLPGLPSCLLYAAPLLKPCALFASRAARLRYKVKGPGVKLNFPDQLTAQRRAELDAMSLEDLLARYRAKGVRHVNKSSQYRGVSWSKNCHKWLAQIHMNGKQVHLGLFADEATAARAYNVAARQRDGM